MKAQDIITTTPIKPELPAVSSFTGAEMQTAYGNAIAAYKAAVAEYPAKRKAHKDKVMKSLERANETKWLELVRDFHRLRTGQAGANDTMVSTWIASIRTAFAKKFVGRVIEPIKAGVQIQGYLIQEVQVAKSKAVVNALSVYKELRHLFRSDVSEEMITAELEKAEANRKRAAANATELKELNIARIEAVTTIESLRAKALTFAEFGAKLPKSLQTANDEAEFILTRISEGITTRSIAAN